MEKILIVRKPTIAHPYLLSVSHVITILENRRHNIVKLHRFELKYLRRPPVGWENKTEGILMK